VNLFYRIIRTICRPLLRVYNRLEGRGLENFPMKGPVLIVANHHSYLDAFVLGAVAPRKIHFMVKRSQFRKWFARWFYWGMDAFPVNQDGRDQEALRRAMEILGRGGIVGLYPAGSRSPHRGLQEWRPGVALLAKHAGVPVLPAAICGTHEAFRKGSALPRPTKVMVVFGEPVRFEEGRGRVEYQRFVDGLRARVAAMLDTREPWQETAPPAEGE
jgi:1-acyl-sn-glycerol-3-phosphate acyltransferase